MSNNLLRWFGFLLLLGSVAILFGGFEPLNDVYRFPLNDHRAISGTFGELRSNHFHSGLDIKTGGKIGAPLYAIQEGYVYRIKVSPYGFGNAVYLRHPDGRFSVYAHMWKFNPTIANYAYERQYANKNYAQELYLSPEEIPVKKGEFIGYSGNSGSSLGPHLHFEIRDPQERILNPLSYYKQQIPDTKKPIVQNIAFDPVDLHSRVRGEFRKLVLTPSGSSGNYSVNQIIKIKGKVGIEYRAYDLLNAAGNHCGINYARLYLDGELIYAFSLDRFAFDEKRYINVHINYPHYHRHRQRYERAYIEAGNRFNAYEHHDNLGLIELTDDAVHDWRLVLTDGHKNQSVVRGKIQRDIDYQPFDIKPNYTSNPRLSYEINRNLLVLTATNPHRTFMDGLRYTNVHGEQKALSPAYSLSNRLIYLLPLARHDYPKVIDDSLGLVSLELNLEEEILSSQNNLVELDELQLFFPYQSVFDRVHLEVQKQNGNPETMYSDVFKVGQPNIPLFKSYLVSFTPKSPIPLTHLVVAYKNKQKWSFAGNTMGEEGNVYASVRDFGEYCLMADSLPPSIEPVNFSNGSYISAGQKSLVLRTKDEFSGINHDKIYCTLNGEWLLFEYDYKRNSLTHDLSKQKRPAKGTYRLEVEVEDKARNRIKKRYTIRF